ncbi:MAG: 2OG-Fe(II) oxygenase superfamily-domain-containing protein [Monoraphidium minutum]|nr:MAG: 2OG-Fe(II) oxygenase superfamily-domain-containing protein [Monoraphidium minutum]
MPEPALAPTLPPGAVTPAAADAGVAARAPAAAPAAPAATAPQQPPSPPPQQQQQRDTGELGATAFRLAEKQYQLHKDLEIKIRNGRRRGGKLVTRPTDLSAVIDLHQPGAERRAGVHCVWVELDAAADACGGDDCDCGGGGGGGGDEGSGEGEGAPHQAEQPPQQQPPQPPQQQPPQPPQQQAPRRRRRRQRAFALDAHPGLVFFPSALPPAAQARLMEEALLTWPEPPAGCNHDAAYPRGLPGLLAAARAGLRSAAAPLAAGGGGGGGYPGGGAGGGGAGAAGGAAAAGGEGGGAAADGQRPAAQGAAPPEARPDSGSRRAAAGGAWARDGAGPPAAELLRRLRWVMLGPSFNWSARAYEPWRPHAPLPRELGRAAVAFEAAARAALAAVDGSSAAAGAACEDCAAAGAAGAQRGGGGGGGDDTAAGAAGARRGGPDAAACGTAAAPPRPYRPDAAACGTVAAPRRPYRPDAALVNYYREGDTLGGHVDDAERDMAAPIVTASLGLGAVFLIGGGARADPPTPLLLRSGDVIVLAGPARRSFHGVPRVLHEAGPPPELAAALAARAAAATARAGAGAGGAEAGEAAALRAACHAHAAGCRINISIRCTA